jgi:tetratricopeptide (TPR) repeat protein
MQFEKLPLGRYTVEVRKDGYRPALRGFQAGTDSPTLVFKLEPSLDDVAKEFDSLVQGGKLVGPETPNASDLFASIAVKYPDSPELTRMRGVLATRLGEEITKVINRTTSDWRAVTRAELSWALGSAAAAVELKGDDKKAQAQAAYLRGVTALRDWQTAGGQPSDASASGGSQAEAGRQNGESPGDAVGLALARGELEKAASLDDAWSAPKYQLGVVLLYAGDLSASEATFAKVLLLEPRWAAAHVGLGSAYHAQGKHKEAIEAFRKAIEINPNYAAAHAGLGLARATKGDTKEGLKDIDRAMQLDRTSGLPHLSLGIIYSKSKKSKEVDRAVEELKKAIEKNREGLEFSNRAAEQMIAEIQNRKRK